MHMKLENRKWTEEELFEVRKEVLAQWPTGKDVEDLDRNIEYVKTVPPHKNWGIRQNMGEKAGVIQVVAQLGHTLFEENLEQLKYSEELRPDGWLIFSDSYTRKLRYELAQQAIDRSYREGSSLLNGIPLANYGVEKMRQLTEATDSCLVFNPSDSDPRLCQEIAKAAGWEATGGHSIQEVIQHSRDYPLDKRLQNTEYADRLSVYYYEHGGIHCQSASAAVLHGWAHPAFKVTLSVLQALVNIGQGIKDEQLSISISNNLIQEVAALRTLKKLAKEYMAKAGYNDIEVSTLSSSWQGDWPRDPDRAAAVCAWGVAIGALAGVSSIRIKSLIEARARPTKEAFASSIRIARQILRLIGQLRLPESQELNLEQEMIEREVRAEVDKTLELGDGDVCVGMVRAVEAGVLDCPFSPWRPLHQKVRTIKDRTKATRYLDYGNLPLPPEVIEYNRQKLAEREKAENRKIDLELMIEDVTSVSKELIPAGARFFSG